MWEASACRTRLGRALRALVVGVLVAALFPSSAFAHAVLIEGTPGLGSVVAALPASISLRFDEVVAAPPDAIELQDPQGALVAVGAAKRSDGGSIVAAVVVKRAGERSAPTGIYTVRWRVVSDDGDPIEGDFEFAVGRGTPQAIVQTSGSAVLPSPSNAATSLLLLLGLGVGAAGLWIASDGVGRRLGRRLLVAGALVASAASAIALGNLNRELGGGWSGALSTPSGRGQAAAAACFAAAAALGLRRRMAIILAVVAAGASVAAGHAGTGRASALSVVIWTLHLLAAASWAASLTLLALAAVTRRAIRAPEVARYARAAIASLAVIAVSGAYQFLIEIRRPSLLLSTAYGELLSAKTALLALTLAAATLARFVGVRNLARGEPRLLRLLLPVECVLVLGIVAIGAVMAETAPSRAEALARRSQIQASLLGPALRLAGLAGSNTITIAVHPTGIAVEALAPTGQPLTDARIDATLAGGSYRASSCGSGCYLIATAPPPGRHRLQLAVSHHGEPTEHAAFLLTWPLPPDQTTLLTRALQQLDTAAPLSIDERVTSDSHHLPPPTRITEPGRTYAQQLYLSPQGATDARITATQQATNQTIRQLSWYLPGARIWHTILLDDHDQILQVRTIAAAHLIVDTIQQPRLDPARRSTHPK